MTESQPKRNFRLLAQRAVVSQRMAEVLNNPAVSIEMNMLKKSKRREPESSSGEQGISQEPNSTTQPSTSTTARRALRLDVNKIRKAAEVAPIQGSQDNPKNFRDVVKTAMLVRNWISSNPPTDDQQEPSFSSEVIEPSSLASDDAPILEEPQDITPPRPTGWEILKDKFKHSCMELKDLAIRPSGTFYYYWSLIVFCAVLYNMLAMVIFIFDDVYRTCFWYWLILNFTGDIIYIFDLLFSIRKIYMADGLEVKNARMMWRYYRTDAAPVIGSFIIFDREVGGRIILDIFCLFPLDIILIFADYVSLLRTIRIIKLHRFLDFIELTKQRSMFPHATKIFFLMLLCYILFHWNACVYYLLSLAEGLSEEDTNAFGFSYYKVFDPRFPQCSVFEDGCLMWENHSLLDLDDERPTYIYELYSFWENKSDIFIMGNFSREYSMSMYWSSLTITTCGQQPYPSSSPQNMLEVVDTLIGVLVFATIIGSVGGVVYLMNQDLNNYRLQMDAIKFYMSYRNVREEIRDRVLKCFMFLHSRHQLTDEKEIVDCLPPRMQGSIASDLHMSTVGGVSLFNGCTKGFLVDIVLRMKQQVFMPNDVLCKVGDKAKEMFIVKSGVLQVTDEEGLFLQEISDGCTYGEMSIIQIQGSAFGEKRQTGLISVGYSDIYILNQDDVLPLFAEYPEERERLTANARRWLRENEMLVEEEDMTNYRMESTIVYSIEEQFDQLQSIIDDMERQLNDRYQIFQDNANDMKQRLTELEWISLKCRDEIRRDCAKGDL